MKHGVMPQTAEEQYEMNWYFETKRDHEKKELFGACYNAGESEDIIDKFVANGVEMHNKFEARWADGRQFVAGNNITAADYAFLAGFTCIHGKDGTGNPGLRNPSIVSKFREAVPEANSVNTMRILANIKAQCQASVDALQPTWI